MPGVSFASCQLSKEENDRVLGSFLYGAIDAREIERQKTFSVAACYQTEFRRDGGHWPVMVAIIANDFKQPDGMAGYHLAAFFGTAVDKEFEINYGGSYSARFGIAALPASGQENPLVFVRRNEGGSGRTITYDLYRLERDRLKSLWEWSDEFSHSTAEAYSISKIDFSRIGDEKQFTLYTTYGNLREMEPGTGTTTGHRVTSFAWNPAADAFQEVRRTN